MEIENNDGILSDKVEHEKNIQHFSESISQADLIEQIASSLLDKFLDDDRFKDIQNLLRLSQKKASILKEDETQKVRREIQKETNNYILLDELIPENNKEILTQLKIDPYAREYLQIIETLYQELSAELQDFPYKKTKNEHYLEACIIRPRIDFLIRLEAFMLSLIQGPPLAFVHLSKKLKLESLDQLKSQMTVLGKELLFIISKRELITKLTSEYLTTNIKILVKFFQNLESNRRQRQGQGQGVTLQQDLTIDSLEELNYFLLELYQVVKSGQLEKNIPKEKLYRQRDGDPEIELYFSFLRNIEFSKEWSKRLNQLENAKLHFRNFMKMNVIFYRMQISITLEGKRVSYEQFNKIFGNFNKQAKNTKHLDGYLDYLYFWKEDFTTHNLILDLVCLFDATKLIVYDNETKRSHQRDIYKEISESLNKIIAEQENLNMDSSPSLHLKELPILNTVSKDFPSEFFIELNQKNKWKFFEQKILPYFIFLESLEIQYSDPIKNRFSRGKTQFKD